MTPVFSYFLQGTVVSAVFYLFYKILLRQDTFFKWSRWYFITAITGSFIFPLIDVSSLLHRSAGSQEFTRLIPDLSFTYLPPAVNLWSVLLNNILLAGMMVMIVRLLLQMIALWKLRKNRKLNRCNNFTIVELDEKINPFSFFNEIYVNPVLHSEAELSEIIQHEQFHIQQKHTIDILLAELMTIIFWFNPFAWLLKNSLKQNLEFLTDKMVLATGVNAKHYQYNLLKVSGLQNNIAAANHFHFLKLKNRIIMMNKKQSHPYQLVKYLLMVPVVAVILMAFSQRKELLQVVKTAVVKDTTPSPPAQPGEVIIADAPGTTLPDNIKRMDVFKSKGVNKVTITFTDGKKETYNLDNEQEKKRFAEKYGEIAAPPPPPPAPDTKLPSNVKSVSINKDNDKQEAVIELNDGTIEKYDLTKPAEKKKLEEKYGKIMAPPPPPPVPVKRAASVKNAKGNYLTVADNNGECVVIVKDSEKKIKEAVLLTDWNNNKQFYEGKYGAIPEIKIDKVSVSPKPLIVVDKQEMPETFDVKSIDPTTIASVNILKDEKATSQYGAKGGNGVIEIILNDGQPAKAVYFVNGKEISAAEANTYKPEQIKSINVLKEKKAIAKYGDKGKNGVIEIELK